MTEKIPKTVAGEESDFRPYDSEVTLKNLTLSPSLKRDDWVYTVATTLRKSGNGKPQDKQHKSSK